MLYISEKGYLDLDLDENYLKKTKEPTEGTPQHKEEPTIENHNERRPTKSNTRPRDFIAEAEVVLAHDGSDAAKER